MIIKLDIKNNIWYTHLYGKEIQFQANREGTKERKGYPSMAWRGEVVCIDDGCGDKIKSSSVVGIKEEIRAQRFLGINRWTARRECEESNGGDKGLYKRTEAVFPGDHQQRIEGIYSS